MQAWLRHKKASKEVDQTLCDDRVLWFALPYVFSVHFLRFRLDLLQSVESPNSSFCQLNMAETDVTPAAGAAATEVVVVTDDAVGTDCIWTNDKMVFDAVRTPEEGAGLRELLGRIKTVPVPALSFELSLIHI